MNILPWGVSIINEHGVFAGFHSMVSTHHLNDFIHEQDNLC